MIRYGTLCRILFMMVFLWALPAFGDYSASLNHVLIVSIDALHPAALETEAAPHIRRLMRRGHFTLRGQSSFPPKTLIAHTAMLTGLAPEESGLFSNEWQTGDPVITRPTIFNSAKGNGYRTAYF